MADELLKFVKEQLKRGYSLQQVKEALIGRGYSPGLIEGVVQSMSSRNAVDMQVGSRKPLSAGISSGKLVVIIVIMVAVVAGAVLAPKLLTKQALLDVTTIPQRLSYYPGEAVKFDVSIFNMGSKSRFDIVLNYEAIDKLGNTVSVKEESVAIGTSLSHTRDFALPKSLEPGRYTLKTTARYEGKEATSSFSFSVDPSPWRQQAENTGSEPSPQANTNTQVPAQQTTPVQQALPNCFDSVKNQDEQGVDCGGKCGGYWYNFKCNSEPKLLVQNQIPQKSIASQLLTIRLLAKTNSDSALQGCLEFTEEKVRDDCIKDISQTSMKSEYCEQIYDVDKRDTCYYPFFMKGDYTICEKLALKESLSLCAQLQQISKLSNSVQESPQVTTEN